MCVMAVDYLCDGFDGLVKVSSQADFKSQFIHELLWLHGFDEQACRHESLKAFDRCIEFSGFVKTQTKGVVKMVLMDK